MTETNLSPQLKPGKLPDPPSFGLGGWFTLIIIGLVGSIIVDIPGIIQLFQIDLIYVDPSYLTFFIFCLLNEVVLSVIILVFIFKRDIVFRMLFVIQTCLMIICYFIYFYFAYTLNLQNNSPITSILARILWTVYLFRSERVNNTFIRFKTQTINEAPNPDEY